jgi:cation diffusion facilitator CzcD-associated flavoprotein CzcO
MTDETDVLVIGAGVAGLCALYRLREAGFAAQVLERGSDVGGVWHWNRYPGARFDSESYTYCFSFSPELLDEWRWRERFAAQPEVHAYLRHVADRFDLRRHVRFRSTVTEARFLEDDGHWLVRVADGTVYRARYLVSAMGALSEPQWPDLEGLESFAGIRCHTARWPTEGLNLDGKRVGIIGTGATGVQVIQTIAATVGELCVFQRTPTYCIPQRNAPIGDAEMDAIRQDYPAILERCNGTFGGFVHDFDPRLGAQVTKEEREALFETLWQRPGFAFWFGNFSDLLMDSEVNEHACEFLRRKIRERVRDPEVARRLLPSHPFGAKRVPLESGYYEAYNRDNVRLVDLRESPIERVTRDGVVAGGRLHALDVLICATGFDAVTGALSRVDVRGVDGLRLVDKWRGGPSAHLGLLVSGFPNLFTIAGPLNAAGLCNAVRCTEQNVDWLLGCLAHMREWGWVRVEARPQAEAAWTRHVQDSIAQSVLNSMTDSWFFGANTPGKARAPVIYPLGAADFRARCEAEAAGGYPGLAFA